MQRNFNESIKKAQSGVNAGRKEAKSRLRRESSRSGNESFLTYFRFLSSHTTVRAVRHTAV